jgi:hypothetical protein
LFKKAENSSISSNTWVEDVAELDAVKVAKEEDQDAHADIKLV